MTRYQVLQALYYAGELITGSDVTGVELGEHVALVGFHDEDGTIYTVTVSKVEPPLVSGTTFRQAGAAPISAHKGRLN